MKILYHCRYCNETGEKELSLDILSKKKEELDIHTLNTIMFLIDHNCEFPTLGIKLADDR